MDKKRFTELLIKKKQGLISLPEQRELLSLLENDLKGKIIYDAIEDFFDTPIDFKHDIDPDEVNNAVNRLNKKIALRQLYSGNKGRRVRFLVSTIAASLIIFFTMIWVFLPKQKMLNNDKSVVATKKGSRSTITLPDGSRVWINNDTKITYDKNFGEGYREVNLIGEAYFDIVKDASRPFIVHTKTLDIKVLGTAFNVRAYADEKNTQTTLLRGSVEILLKNEEGKRIMLKPNEKIVVQNAYAAADTIQNKKSLPDIVLSSVEHSYSNSPVIETQWMENRLAFDGDKIEDVAIILERWYNIKVIIKDPSLSNKKVKGVFEDRSLNNVMEALSLAVGFKYTIDENNNITISAN